MKKYIWCWVTSPWDYLRIAVFYGPVWFVIFLTFTIYLRGDMGTRAYEGGIGLCVRAEGLDTAEVT
jgi:hypothetical protein